jgi:orotidine-5'-phosphate decarboxylase
MTDRKDFKNVVRNRAKRTGEPYSTALRNVRKARPDHGDTDADADESGAQPAARPSAAPDPRAFAERFASIRASVGPLVWGLDPSGSLLESWGLGDTPDGLARFVDIVVDAAPGVVGIVKPQSAFYERHGWRGMRSLSLLIEGARAAGLLVILDAKRGDVGSTNDAYAEAFFGPDAPFDVDALTVHPYLGLQAMGSLVSRAHEFGANLFVMVRSSNPEGDRLQSSTDDSGVAVDRVLLAEIGAINATLAPGVVGPVGAVIGPNRASPSLDLAGADALYLAPGVGAQGATTADVARVFASCPDRVLPSASRSLLASGPDRRRLRADAAALQRDVVAALGAATTR